MQVRVNAAGKVEYVRNGLIIYTSKRNPTYPLAVDSSFYSEGAAITNVTWISAKGFDKGPKPAKAGDPVKFSGVSSVMRVSGRQIQKNGGGNGWNNGIASEQAAITANSTIKGVAFECQTTNKYLMVGLNSQSSDNSLSYTDIDFALYIHSGGQLKVYEHGCAHHASHAASTLAETFSTMHTRACLPLAGPLLVDLGDTTPVTRCKSVSTLLAKWSMCATV